MTRTSKRLLALLGAAAACAVMSSGNVVSGQGTNPCGMQLNQQPVIFCDTFDFPRAVNNRSGQMDGVIWGVSRIAGGGVVWPESTMEACDGPRTVSPAGATDVIICNGRVRTSQMDNHDVTAMAMYPKQPFDWAGRTGTVSFDVTNDTSGSHGAWPEFWITDLPTPAPNAHLVPCDTCTVSKHAFGIRFAADRGICGQGWRADSAVVVRNWVIEDRTIFENNTSGMQVRDRGTAGCASLSSGPNGGLNHIEIRISQNDIDVYASDAGSKTLKLINTIRNANLSFSKGLIWVGDYHYNAIKAADDPNRPNQQTHTYSWDNVAFDGPATYRDLSFDVLDKTTNLGNGLIEIGWKTTPSAPANLNTLPMTTANIQASSSAYLLFHFGKDVRPSTFNYTINGHANSVANPQPASGLLGFRALALPVPLNQLVNGPNNIRLSADLALQFQNVNIVLVAAAPVPGAGPQPTAPVNLRIMQ